MTIDPEEIERKSNETALRNLAANLNDKGVLTDVETYLLCRAADEIKALRGMFCSQKAKEALREGYQALDLRMKRDKAHGIDSDSLDRPSLNKLNDMLSFPPGHDEEA